MTCRCDHMTSFAVLMVGHMMTDLAYNYSHVNSKFQILYSCIPI